MNPENFNKVKELMEDLSRVNNRLEVAESDSYQLEVFVKNKNNSGLKVNFPPEFSAVAKRVIVTALEKQAKLIESKLHEL